MRFICLAITMSMILAVDNAAAQGGEQKPAAVFSEFEPSATHPFGRPNPNAPEGTQEYAFMIGEWICDNRVRKGGDWNSFTSKVRANYFLNGYGIMNHSYGPDSASAMTYEYDAAAKEWTVTNSVGPGFRHTDWKGKKEPEGMVARRMSTAPNGAPITLATTFHNISKTTFDWKLEVATPNGALLLREKSCRRL